MSTSHSADTTTVGVTPTQTLTKTEYSVDTSPAATLVRVAPTVLRKMVAQTQQKQKEHGVIIWPSAETISHEQSDCHVSDIIEGANKTSVRSQIAPPKTPQFFDLHTHPPDSTATFSDNDIKSMLGSIVQHPPRDKETLKQYQVRRTFGIIATPFGYPDDKGLVKTISVGDDIADLSIDDQTELTQDILQGLESRNELKPLEKYLNRHMDIFSVDRKEFDIPPAPNN